MRLEQLRDGWNRLGTIDPMWAILTDAEKLGNRWLEGEFFDTGRLEIDTALEGLKDLLGRVPSGRALDFGCGIGRLSRALCLHFAEVAGVDIAATMIEQARLLNRYPERCTFVLNERADLAIFEDRSFDFIYSSITLQHIAPKLARLYLAEFSRILKVGGVLMFQIPLPLPLTPRYIMLRMLPTLLSRSPRPLFDAYRRLRYRNAGEDFFKDAPRILMEMHGLSKRAIEASFTSHDMICLEARCRENAGPGWRTFAYTFMRLGGERLPR